MSNPLRIATCSGARCHVPAGRFVRRGIEAVVEVRDIDVCIARLVRAGQTDLGAAGTSGSGDGELSTADIELLVPLAVLVVDAGKKDPLYQDESRISPVRLRESVSRGVLAFRTEARFLSGRLVFVSFQL